MLMLRSRSEANSGQNDSGTFCAGGSMASQSEDVAQIFGD